MTPEQIADAIVREHGSYRCVSTRWRYDGLMGHCGPGVMLCSRCQLLKDAILSALVKEQKTKI